MKNEQQKAKKPIYKRVWFWILAVIVVIVVANGSGGQTTPPVQPAGTVPAATTQPAKEPAKPEPAKNKPSMNKAEFDKLESGMTYEQATEIIGGPGTVLSESGKPGDQYHTVMYQYEGDGGLGANANLMFQGNKLQNKAQMGLK